MNRQNSAPKTPEPMLEVHRLSLSYGGRPILLDVSLGVAISETLVVLGESGCGKTTLLKAIAGLVTAQSGTLSMRGIPFGRLTRDARRVIYLDQEPLLFEHLTVAENIGFAMRMQGGDSAETARRVDEMLAAIELGDLPDRYPSQLSGGQKQRVAFARAILGDPRVLLLDEPFSSLDGRTRSQMQRLFQTLKERFSLTSLFVTHDVKEALIVGDRFARMDRGSITYYPSREAFIDDPQTGVRAEIEFWSTSLEQSPQDPKSDERPTED